MHAEGTFMKNTVLAGDSSLVSHVVLDSCPHGMIRCATCQLAGDDTCLRATQHLRAFESALLAAITGITREGEGGGGDRGEGMGDGDSERMSDNSDTDTNCSGCNNTTCNITSAVQASEGVESAGNATSNAYRDSDTNKGFTTVRRGRGRRRGVRAAEEDAEATSCNTAMDASRGSYVLSLDVLADQCPLALPTING